MARLRLDGGRKPSATWIPDVAANEGYVSQESTSGTATRGRVVGDHVEVEGDFTFPSGSVHGKVVAVICR